MDYTSLLNLRLVQLPFFSSFPGQDLEALREHIRIRKVPAGSRIIRRGEHPASMTILLSGSADVCRIASEARNVIFRRQFSPVLYGYCLLADRRYSADVVVAEPSVLGTVLVSHVKALLKKNPDAMYVTISHLSALIDDLSSERIEVSGYSLEQRVVTALSRTVSHDGICHLSHEELAEMVGATRPNVSRVLKHLETDGRVELGRRQIRLLIGHF